ncbi:hypothetical protein SLEP1_g27359 [Rubroshorea leprosula]|uniref:non-specific serine/threonine protein kinase n=1 Tax=Rubroshorea leprosula TaxID=152421 RepID=A0AAV5JW85_9ROSI|nr:hypothetical protein SLEP1_g27359 [Rubroshorea leprosula]
MNYFLLFVMILLVFSKTPLSSSNPDLYGPCSKEFKCGNVSAGFPFWAGYQRPRECGHPGLQLQCEDNDAAILEIVGVRYRVLEINQETKRLKIAREDYEGGICSRNLQDTTLDATLFVSAKGYVNLTLLYGCSTSIPFLPTLGNFSCRINGSNYSRGLIHPGVPTGPISCSASVTVLVHESFRQITTVEVVEQELKDGFEVEWKVADEERCQKCISIENCGINDRNKTVCYCSEPNGSFEECPPFSPPWPPVPSPPAQPPSKADEQGKYLMLRPQLNSVASAKNSAGQAHVQPGKKKTTILPLGLFIAGGVIAGILQTVWCFLSIESNKIIAAQFSQSKDLPASPSSKGLGPTTPSTEPSESIPSCSSPKSDLEKGSTYFGVQVFSNSEFEEATHNFDPSQERVEAFLSQYGSLAPKRFSYSDIKKITDSFKDKLGKGGYGIVYKGELLDGRIVAVKVLRKPKGDGQDFINEVASISRTSHVNIVSLMGFCYERSKRALVYEFMPNGSLDKFIYNQGSTEESHQLAIKTLYEIALGIGRGLEYLHRGCTTRILHFDIKPQNILLDANFYPKISDFGLAKLCETRDTIVSMTVARGTCGYIAPEVFCRNFGGVSYKSDVYSYGMLVLEMIGGRRKNVNLEESHSSEMYFPTWLYKQLEKSEKLNLDRIIADEEEEMTRKMIIVSLWCIQTIPSNRPSMSKVLEMLQGSLEALLLPPEPLLSSPAPISLQNSNTTSSVIMQVRPYSDFLYELVQ